ncbi:MAG: PepSY-like domain-containing protein [Sedimentisphaerales bacterium]|nr:PepSY-like domain-containing protein [Sedimentisphaerales bacterium]
MKAQRYRSVGMVLAVAALLSVATYAERDGTRLPAAVRKALRNLYPDATLEEAKAEMEGMRVYEVELEQGERDVTLTVTPDGTVLEVETEIALEELPQPVKAALRRAAGDAQIEEVSKEVTHWVVTLKKLEKPEVSYEAEVVKDGREMELEFAADGTLLQEDDDADHDEDADEDDDEDDEDDDEDEDEERVSLDDVPKAVRATIQKRARNAEIEEIERDTENGKTVYEAVIELRISSNGKVLGPEKDDEDDD